MKDIKVVFALACAFALGTSSALAQTAHHKSGVRVHHAHRSVPQVRSGFMYRGYGDPGSPTGTVSAGGTLWNGRSASEWGGG